MGMVDSENRNRFERRIGRRLEVVPIDVTWVVREPGRFRRRKPPLELPGRIENVSLAGAAIVGPAELDLVPGAKAVIRAGGSDSTVIVRHRSPLAGGSWVRFGVELPHSGSALERRFQKLLDPMVAPPAARAKGRPPVGIRPGDPVLDLTDATIAAYGEPVLEVGDPATALADELRALDPLILDRSAVDSSTPAAVPTPEAMPEPGPPVEQRAGPDPDGATADPETADPETTAGATEPRCDPNCP